MKNKIKTNYIVIFLSVLFCLTFFSADVFANNTYQETQIISGVNNWHEKDYKGSDVEIIVIDKGNLSNSYKNIENVEDPFGNVIINQKNVSSHLSKVVETIHLNVPDAKIYVFQDISMIYIYEWMKENNKDIDLINFSLSRNLTNKEKEVMPLFANENVMMFTAIGNNASKEINPVSENPYWYSVGAVEINRGNVARAYYSGISKDLSFMSFSDIYIEDNYKFSGTSASTAFMTGLIGVYIDGYKKTNNKDLSRTDIENMMKRNVIKISGSSKEYYGNGLVRLPSIKSLTNEEIVDTTINESNTLENQYANPNNSLKNNRGITKSILTKVKLKSSFKEKNIAYLKMNYFNVLSKK